MFCSSCGGKLQEGVAFCSGCGAKAGGGEAVVQTTTVAAAPQTQSTMVRDFRCNSCGSPLKIPTNASAAVKCPSCKTECLIERAIRNAEIAAKENIESGIPLTATPAKLHSIVAKHVANMPNLPLDVFDKIEIIREERYCVPAFIFHCNGTESFNYEAGNEKIEKYPVDRGTYVEVRTNKQMIWTPSSGTASVRKVIFATGNRKLQEQFNKLYKNIDVKKLVDIENLIYPVDVDTVSADIPQTTAFNEFAVPIIDNELEKKARAAVAKQTVSGFQLGGSNIQKEVTRIYLGMYCIVFKYNEKEHRVWVNGDGSENFMNTVIPADKSRENTVKKHKEKIEEIEKDLRVLNNKLNAVENRGFGCGFGFLVFAGIVGIIGGITLVVDAGNYEGGAALIIVSFLLTVAFIILGVNRKNSGEKEWIKRRNEIRPAIENAEKVLQEEKRILENFRQQTNPIKKFKNQKKAMRGIYESVSGDASAFDFDVVINWDDDEAMDELFDSLELED
ncbi:MAG: zinc ribbon domain-containing protein [Lachnospiraceae bacterium]|nr:zinc ribbon domain-containing protein [Lachnospiraceae bacterium]